MTTEKYLDLKSAIIEKGYAHEIDWIENIQPCGSAADFADEAIWVILNSGMKEQIARMIWNKIQAAWKANQSTRSAFGHEGKVNAIDYIKHNKERLFYAYLAANDKMAYLETLPFIGKITKFHLAKNLGHDVVKPDRHLVRIAKDFGFSNCVDLCNRIRCETGDKVSMIDMVLWRSANLGMI